MTNKVEICGFNTNTLPKINCEESLFLMKKAKDGDEVARDYFILCNIRLVLSVLKRFSNKKNSDDLFQVGCVGLLKALNNFDITLNVKFSTYAVPMIIGEIRRFLRDSSAFKIGRNIRDIAYRAMQTREKLELNGVDQPSISEIAAEMELSEFEVCDALDAICDPYSLYDCVFDSGDGSIMLLEQIKDETNTDEKWIEETVLKEAITKLSDKERNVILMRFYEGKTQMEIADEINISQAQVSRIEKSAVFQISQYMT